eukprot:9501055-Pyramimonas_sp.AAC.1
MSSSAAGAVVKRPAGSSKPPPSLRVATPTADASQGAQTMRDLFGDVDGSLMLDLFWEKFDA